MTEHEYSDTWKQVMASIEAQQAARKGMPFRQFTNDEGEIEFVYEDAVEAFSVVYVSADQEGIEAGLGPSPKKVVRSVRALGWDLKLGESRTAHEAVYIVKDGTKPRKDGTLAYRGDLRTAATDHMHTTVAGVSKPLKVAFVATWLDDRFESAIVHDSVGVPVLNEHDYWRTKEGVKPIVDYNDGSTRIDHVHFFGQATPFTAWLDDYVALLAPEALVVKKPRAPRKTKDELLLEGQEWTA